MNILHEFLEQESPLYKRWHEHPNHSFHHFLVLAVIAVSVSMSLLTAIFMTDFGGNSQLAAPAASVATTGSPDSLQGMTNQVFTAIDAYLTVEGRAKDTARAQLLELLNRRSDALRTLMEENPEAALREVLPADVVASLPSEVAGVLEQYVTVKGPVRILHEDLFEEGRQVITYTVKDKGGKGTFVLRTPGGFIDVRPGDEFAVTGASLKGELLFAAGAGTVTASGPVSTGIADSYSTGEQKILIIPITFTDNTSQPYTPTQLKDMFFTGAGSVAAHYSEYSYGKLTLTGDVVPQYIPVPYSSADVCGAYFDAAYNAAIDGAKALGINTGNYQIHSLMNPPVGCRGGAAYYPGWGPSTYSMNNMYGQPSIQEVVEHELGHNLAENHSATYFCGSQSIAATGCSQSEYGDSLDPLGTYNGQHNHYNVAHKHGMGWFTSGNIQTVTGSGTFTIAPLEATTSGLQALRIPKPDTGQHYYVGYRQPIGLDASLNGNVMRGAGIWLTNDTGSYPDLTRLLDAVPSDGTSVESAMLQDGATFTDAANGLTITQVSHDTNGVTVSVQKSAAPCVPGQTAMSITPATQTAGANGQTLQYTVTVTNTDSTTCAPQTYSLVGAVPTGWTGTLTPTSLSVNPGSSAQTTFRTTAPSGTANGSYTVTASAQGSDAQHTASKPATHVIYLDAQPPSVTLTAPATGSTIKTANLTVTAQASDNMGVTKVEFLVDTVVQATDTSSPYSWKMNARKFSKGAHTVTAKAYDAAGNTSTASASVTIQ